MNLAGIGYKANFVTLLIQSVKMANKINSFDHAQEFIT